MDLTLDRPALADALARVAGAAAGRTTKPILSGVLIRAEPGTEPTLTACDTEVGVRATLPAGGGMGLPGGAVVDLDRLRKIVGAADTATVKLSPADNFGVEVRAGGKWTLPGYDPAEYPEFPAFPDGEPWHEVAADVLRQLIRRTSYAADKTDSTRFALSGVLWEWDHKTVRLVATDSKRLAVCEGAVDAADGDAPKGTHLLPSRAIALLEKNLGGEPVRVCLRPNEAMFRTPTTTIHTRLVEGRYPPYADILKSARKGSPTSITLPVGAFASRVRQAQICTDDESKRVDMVFGGGRVTMAARGSSSGSADVELPLPEYAGPELSVAFDPQYVLDFLKAIDGEPTVTLTVTDGTKPALLSVGSVQYCVMPLAG